MRDWLRGPLLGAALGLPILGGGGRLAMHAVSLLAAGVAGGVIYAVLARILPARRVLRDVVFGVVLVSLGLRGLNPVQPLTLALFMPVVLLYGIALERSWHARPHSTRTLNTSP
jgi:hypothetical protein